MTPQLHDPTFRDSARRRLRALSPDTQRTWGKMSVDQMLWHVNAALENSLGRSTLTKIRIPLPSVLLKFIVISLPWRKGNTPTAPEFMAKGPYDFDQERRRTLQLMDEFAAVPIDGTWNDSALLGPMNGREWSRLQAKHLDHHLKQFGV